MKILLINANPSNYNPVFPIGLDYIASELKQGNIEYDFLDLQLTDEDYWSEKVKDRMVSNNYNIIGVSIRNLMDDVKDGHWYLPQIRNLIETIRNSVSKGTTIALGGSGLSLCAKEVLEFCHGDVAIAGDGEKAIMELIDHYRHDNILSGKVYYNRLSKDELWNKRYTRGNLGDLSVYIKNKVIGNVQTKRGCPIQCAYCSYPIIEGSIARLRNPESIILEIKDLISLGFKELFFTDSVFNVPQHHSISILEQIRRENVCITWHAFHSPKGITQEYIDLYKETNKNCPPIQLTVESGSDSVLKSLNKNYTIRDIIKAIDICRSNGIEYCFSILAGCPNETKESLDETLELIKYANPNNVSLFTGVCIHPETTLAFLTKNLLWRTNMDLIKPVFYPLDKELIHEFMIEYNKFRNEMNRSEEVSNNYCNYSYYSNYHNYSSMYFNSNQINNKKL